MAKSVVVEAVDAVKEFPTGPIFPGPLSKFSSPPALVLDEVNFKLTKGLNLALLGPNGSGKTTLLKTLATIYRPDAGKIYINGLDMDTETKEIRKQISFVSPTLQFLGKLTLKQTMQYFARVTGSDMKLGMEFLEELDLLQKLNDPLQSFSVGQQAITRLCIALQKDPEVLFLDEVTSGLDARRKEAVMSFLEKQAKQRTIVLVDHDSMVLDRVCDRILLLKRGGTVDRMLTLEELLHGLDYSYDVMMIPKKELTLPQIEEIWPKYESIGGTNVRFVASDANELEKMQKSIVNYGDFIDYRVSGLSIDDIVLKWIVESQNLEGHSDNKTASNSLSQSSSN